MWETTGPEIWNDTAGRVHGFNLRGGVGRDHRGRGARCCRPRGVKVALSDPEGSGLYKLLYRQGGWGKLDHRGHRAGGASPPISKAFHPRRTAYKIPDSEALPIVFDLLGGGGGSALVGPRGSTWRARYAWRADMGPGHTIVTILCDYGTR